jgi:DNA-directed RNA polymerase specialized sigma24 family protein
MYASTKQRNRERVQALADQLYRERHRYLMRIAARNAASHADAEEAMQDAFISFIDHYEPDSEAPPLAWLTLTLKRQCWAKRRKAHLDRSVGQEVEQGEGPGTVIAAIPSRATGPEQLVAGVEEARGKLAVLKPQQLRALGLLAAGYSYREIAALNRWTHTKVNRCISEGRAALRARAATEQPQRHRGGGEVRPARALAPRPAKKGEPVDSSDLDRLVAGEVVR